MFNIPLLLRFTFQLILFYLFVLFRLKNALPVFLSRSVSLHL